MTAENEKQDDRKESQKLTPEENEKWNKAILKGLSTQGRAKL